MSDRRLANCVFPQMTRRHALLMGTSAVFGLSASSRLSMAQRNDPGCAFLTQLRAQVDREIAVVDAGIVQVDFATIAGWQATLSQGARTIRLARRDANATLMSGVFGAVGLAIGVGLLVLGSPGIAAGVGLGALPSGFAMATGMVTSQTLLVADMV